MGRPVTFTRLKMMPFEVKEFDLEGRTVSGFVNVPSPDRANEVVEPEAFLRAWDGSWGALALDNYAKGGEWRPGGVPGAYKLNPIFTYNHNVWEPIGTVRSYELVDGKAFYTAYIGTAKLDGRTPPDEVLKAIGEGTIRTSSFGYNEMLVSEPQQPGQARVIHDFELMDTSAVSLPCHPEATVQLAKSLGLAYEYAQSGKGATAFADLPLAPEDMAWSWDAPAGNAVLGDPEDWGRYKKAHFWFDPENAQVRAGYKLPFAKMVDGSLKAVWRGCAAAMGALLGGRGGVDIPEGDVTPVYNHISKYYGKFDKPVPELKGAPLGEALVRGVRPEFADVTWKNDENYLVAEEGLEADLKAINTRAEGSRNVMAFLAKEGRVLSAANVRAVEAAIEALAGADSALRALLEAAAPKDEGKAALEAAWERELAGMPAAQAAILRNIVTQTERMRGASAHA
jgi:hypothetical protein